MGFVQEQGPVIVNSYAHNVTFECGTNAVIRHNMNMLSCYKQLDKYKTQNGILIQHF
jgi:threonine aldolase